MKKEKLIKFINLLLNKKIIKDDVSFENYKLIKHVIENNDYININNFKHIIKRSIPILNKMYKIYNDYKDEYFYEKEEISVNYQIIRKELNYFPSFNEIKAEQIKYKILKINNKYYYQLKIDNIKINLYFYSEYKDIILFQNLAKIIYLFIKTFGIDLEHYNNYNIRFLLIDFPRILDSKNQTNANSFHDLGLKGYFNNSSGVHILGKKELVVSRKSGLTGLLIHELIHMLGLDFCFNFENKNQINLLNWEKNWILNNNINRTNNNIRSFIESICNTNSSYFVAIYNSIYICSRISCQKNLKKIFKYLFYMEVIHCYINGVKLLNYFNFNTYDSFFNNTNNRIFYQDSLVFEYIIMRMFIINDYYKLILKKMISYDFNKLTSDDINLSVQEYLNQKLINQVRKKSLKIIFDNISKSMNTFKVNTIFMEYFPLDLLN